MSTYIGIDLGTSATKAVALNEAGEILARSRCAHPASRSLLSGRVDPRAWEGSVRQALADLGTPLGRADGVGIDVHCPVAVPLDRRGRPCGLGVVWDNDILRYYSNQYSERRSVAAVRATGNHASQSTFLAVAYPYLRAHDPEAFTAMTTFGMAGTWLGSLLTSVTALDQTQASYTGIFDTLAPDNGWIEETVELLGIEPSTLPTVRHAVEILGHVTPTASEELGLPAGIPVTVGSADTPAAAYALGTSPGTKPFLIMGTTHVVNSCLAAPDLRAAALQRCGNRPGEWLINGVTNGGDALATGARLTGFGADGTDSAPVTGMIRAALEISHEDAVAAPSFIPHVMRERGPLWFESPCSQIIDITRETTRPQVARAVVDGVLLVDRMVLRSCVPRDSGSIYLTGAFGAEEDLPQMLADAVDMDLDLVDESYLPAIGAAGMVGEAVEGMQLPEVVSRRVSPRPDWVAVNNERWGLFRTSWAQVTGHEPLPEI